MGSPSAHSVYLDALSLLPVILKVTKYCALWVKVHIARLLFDGVVSFCVHLSGIRWVRICVSSGLFLCAASCYATQVVVCCGVEWGGANNIQLYLSSQVMLRYWTLSCRSTDERCCYVEDVAQFRKDLTSGVLKHGTSRLFQTRKTKLVTRGMSKKKKNVSAGKMIWHILACFQLEL